MQNARLDDLQAGIKIAGRNISNLRYADDTRKWQKAKRNYKSFLMRVKEENDKAGLKQHSKNQDHGSRCITSQQIQEEKVETVTDFIFLGSIITVDSDCSHKIKRRLLLGRKARTNLDSIIKSRHITLPTKLWFFQ